MTRNMYRRALVIETDGGEQERKKKVRRGREEGEETEGEER